MSENNKMVIICNNAATGTMPSMIMGASGVALDYKVILFFTPGGAQSLVNGELEKFQGLKGLPDPVELFNTVIENDSLVIFCELAIENKGIDVADLRDGVVVMKAPRFLMEAEGAQLTFTF